MLFLQRMVSSKKIARLKFLFVMGVLVVLLQGCVTLQPVSINQRGDVSKYNYMYIVPTGDVTSGNGAISYGLFGYESTTTVNPGDVIAGYLVKRGFIRLPELVPELSEKTMIVSYGETNRSFDGLLYHMEVTVQFLSAGNHLFIGSFVADGAGDTESDAIREAISRGLDSLFSVDSGGIRSNEDYPEDDVYNR